MCGRFAFYSPTEAAAALFGAADGLQAKPRYNIAPTQELVAVRVAADRGRELALLRWGLVPFWAKDPSIGNRMINARAETVAEEPSFRNAYKQRRCLVLADGFYEWQRKGDVKVPWFISLASGQPFAFAGLWENWTDKETGESLQTATIVTTAANEFMKPLHDRMPVLLEPATGGRWLDGDMDLLADPAGIIPALRAWPVDRRVNNARNEGRDLIEPVGQTVTG
ncbi:MAG: SOS response-associated peptidase [Gammaproteobacteria bacterium]|nr:SOS response-associated peptidase [Gammaproteobacteria bacterium]